MSDRIVNPNDYDWIRKSPKQSVYDHLMDGKAREVDVRDYKATNTNYLRIAISARARHLGLTYRAMVLDENLVLFQVTGKK